MALTTPFNDPQTARFLSTASSAAVDHPVSDGAQHSGIATDGPQGPAANSPLDLQLHVYWSVQRLAELSRRIDSADQADIRALVVLDTHFDGSLPHLLGRFHPGAHLMIVAPPSYRLTLPSQSLTELSDEINRWDSTSLDSTSNDTLRIDGWQRVTVYGSLQRGVAGLMGSGASDADAKTSPRRILFPEWRDQTQVQREIGRHLLQPAARWDD